MYRISKWREKIHIINEDGKEIDIDKIVKICNETHFLNSILEISIECIG